MTLRQRYILQCLADGDSNKLIAHKLGLSRRTVEALIKDMRNGLNARNAAHAVAIAIREGYAS